jgi:hypothetical protein
MTVYALRSPGRSGRTGRYRPLSKSPSPLRVGEKEDEGGGSNIRTRRNRSTSRKRRECQKKGSPDDSDDDDEEFTLRSFVGGPNTEMGRENCEVVLSDVSTAAAAAAAADSRKRDLEDEEVEVIKRNKPSGAVNYRQNYLSIIQEEEELERMGGGSPFGSRPGSIYGAAMVFKPSAAALRKAMEGFDREPPIKANVIFPVVVAPVIEVAVNVATETQTDEEENIMFTSTNDDKDDEKEHESSKVQMDCTFQMDSPTKNVSASYRVEPIYAKIERSRNSKLSHMKEKLISAIGGGGGGAQIKLPTNSSISGSVVSIDPSNIYEEVLDSSSPLPALRLNRTGKIKAQQNTCRTKLKAAEPPKAVTSDSMVGRFFRSLSRRNPEDRAAAAPLKAPRSTSVPPKKREDSAAAQPPLPPRRVGSLKGVFSKSDLVSAVGTKLEVRAKQAILGADYAKPEN